MSVVCSKCGWIDPARKIEELSRDNIRLRADLAAANERERLSKAVADAYIQFINEDAIDGIRGGAGHHERTSLAKRDLEWRAEEYKRAILNAGKGSK